MKKAITALLSIGVFLLIFLLLQRLVTPKYADDVLEGTFTAEYYEETTPHDVILVGDCEVYENVDPIYLWEHYGITSYIRGNAQQLTWQSYYMLEDTLYHETPKVVIYNVQALTHGTPQREEYNRMTMDGMKWSKTKWEGIKASMCEDENMIDYIIPMFRYHQRITQLTESDFKYFRENPRHTHNGYYMRIDVLPVSQSDVADIDWLMGDEEEEAVEEDIIEDPWAAIPEADEQLDTARTPTAASSQAGEEFGDYPMEYLDKMRKLCEENNIQLILMKAPSAAPQWYSTDEEQVVEYADKYGLPYINFYTLIDQLEIDYETDTYDGGLHMNLSGADKISEYLGSVLTEEYGIKDHRQDEEIAEVYKEKVKRYYEEIDTQQEQLEQYGKVLK